MELKILKKISLKFSKFLKSIIKREFYSKFSDKRAKIKILEIKVNIIMR